MKERKQTKMNNEEAAQIVSKLGKGLSVEEQTELIEAFEVMTDGRNCSKTRRDDQRGFANS
jgi:hypothetical protein